MIRSRLAAVFVAAVVVAAGVGVPVVAAQQGNTTDTEGNETTGGDVPDEYLAEVDDGGYIVEYEFTQGEVAVTWYIAADAAPVTVQYADVGRAVEGEPGVRTPAVQTDAIVQSGEVVKRYPAADGPAGQITQLSVDGNPVVIEGEGTADTSILTTLKPTPALVVGAVAGVVVAGIVAYRNRTEELTEPIRAHDVWERK